MAAKRKIEIKDRFVQQLISETANLYKNNALSGNDVATFHENTDVIAHCCKITGYSKVSVNKQSVVRSAITPYTGVQDYDSFVKEINSLIEAQIDPKRAVVLFRLHTDHDTALEFTGSLSIGGNLRIVSIDEYLPILKRSHNVVTQMENVAGFWEYAKSGSWCELSIKDKNFRSAVNAAINIIEIARSLLNYFFDMNRVHFQSSPQPMTQIPPSKYYFEIYNEEVAWWKYSIGDFKYLDQKIEKDFRKIIIDECNKVYAIKKSRLKESIIASIMLLTEGLGCSRYDQMFILLWTIIDVLIPKIDTNEDLLTYIFIKGREKRQRTIKMLHDKRNLFIHQGVYSCIDENSINQLKLIVESLIQFCCNVSDSAKTTTDIVFLLSKIKNENIIANEKKLLSLAEKLLENRKKAS